MLQDRHNQTIEDRLFSRRKSLLTVQQYASSQGISAGVVNECAKLGVVQVRKHKNKTFIVDLPLDANKNAKQQEDDKVEQVNAVQQAQRISSMVNKIFQPSMQIVKPDLKTPVQAPQAVIPDLKLFAQEEKHAQTIPSRNEPVPQLKISSMRKFTDAFKISLINRIILGILSVGATISIIAYWSTSYESRIQEKNLQKAYANISRLMNEYDSVVRKAKLYELDSSNWRAESQRNEKTLASLEVELVKAKEKLAQTESSLSDVQQNHVETLRKLNQQIEEIASKVKAKQEN